jgi:hypothetical protein
VLIIIDLYSEDSIILSRTSIKLTDADNTFNKEKKVDALLFSPIKKVNPYLVNGDFRAGTQINNDYYLLYAANRWGSNATVLCIGKCIKEKMYFLREYFCADTIYKSNPKLNARDLIVMPSLDIKSIKNINFFRLQDFEKTNLINIKKYLECGKIINDNFDFFENALGENVIEQLRR